mgnify:CR=1 FL=1|tara:strand:- start:1779 stop:2390 length:612 start_codon:yes stop_codon:yes gene_type:complete
MAKGTSDIILRDRLQFTLGAAGDLSLVYGRIDLSDYVNVVKRSGLLIKDLYIQIRDPNHNIAGNTNTGTWSIIMSDLAPTAPVVDVFNNFKLFVSTRAYEDASDVGIASPDVLHIEDYVLVRQETATQGIISNHVHNIYPMRDYHPAGYPVVSDLLVGIAVDLNETDSHLDDATLEVDIMLVAETTKVTEKHMTQLLTQAQDL